jgi:hypothetical protein
MTHSAGLVSEPAIRMGRFCVGLRVAAVAVLAGLLAGCGVYDLPEIRGRAVNDWNRVETAFKDRTALAGELIAIMETSDTADAAALTRLENARSAADNTLVASEDLDDATAVAAYTAAQTELVSAIEEALVAAADQDIFRGHETAAFVIEDLGSSQAAIEIAASAYNDSAAAYNAARREFPNKIWADRIYSDESDLVVLETTAAAITIPPIDLSPEPALEPDEFDDAAGEGETDADAIPPASN